MNDIEYEIGTNEEEMAHVRDVLIQEPPTYDLLLTPETVQKYFVDMVPLPQFPEEQNIDQTLYDNISIASDEGQLSDSDFNSSFECLDQHSRDLIINVPTKELQNDEYIFPDDIKSSFHQIASSIPDNVLFRKSQEAFLNRPMTDPIRRKIAGRVLAAFAMASYQTLFPGELERLVQQRIQLRS